MAKSSADASANWLARAQGATQNYKDGVGRVQTDPGQLAAAQRQAYVAGVQANVDIWAKKVQTGVENWKAAAQGKGGDRYAGGIAAGAQKQAAFMDKFLPKAQSIARALPARGTLEANLNRMVQNARELAKLKGTF